MRSIELRLLGTLELRRDGRIVALPRSKKTRALLAYLAATGRPHARASLCELLWDGPDDPRGALRWSLAKIRPLALGTHTSLLVTDGEEVAMDPSGVDIDLAAIRANLGADPAAAAIDVLRRSADRFRGEFLEGLDLPDCYRYHEWWTAERESIRALRVSVLSTLVRRLAGDPDAALACARARLLVDPCAEDAHISVIELLAASGRTREALQQYESCRRMLEGQLGARPSSALERARSALGAGRTAERDARVPALVRAEPTRTTPLVGERHCPRRPRLRSGNGPSIRPVDRCTAPGGTVGWSACARSRRRVTAAGARRGYLARRRSPAIVRRHRQSRCGSHDGRPSRGIDSR